MIETRRALSLMLICTTLLYHAKTFGHTFTRRVHIMDELRLSFPFCFSSYQCPALYALAIAATTVWLDIYVLPFSP